MRACREREKKRTHSFLILWLSFRRNSRFFANTFFQFNWFLHTHTPNVLNICWEKVSRFRKGFHAPSQLVLKQFNTLAKKYSIIRFKHDQSKLIRTFNLLNTSHMHIHTDTDTPNYIPDKSMSSLSAIGIYLSAAMAASVLCLKIFFTFSSGIFPNEIPDNLCLFIKSATRQNVYQNRHI